MIKNKIDHQSFNDGVIEVYETQNSAPAGSKPKISLVFKQLLRYKERTVGINRYYKAMQGDVEIHRLIRTPRLDSISTQDIAVPNDNHQYKIVQVQYPEDIYPPVMDLSLSRLAVSYDIPK